MRRAELTTLIEQTKLGPDVSRAQIEQLCQETLMYGFYGVCVSPPRVALAHSLLKDSSVKLVTVIGFPHGTHTAAVKAEEAGQAIRDGADELDLVIHIAALKERDYGVILQEMFAVREETKKSPRPMLIKIILEAALLTADEKVAGGILAKAAGADFVKTSTGFGPGGATVEDVKLLREIVGPEMGVKAAGGIRDYETAAALLQAGATRLGTSSGVQIIEGAPA